MSDYFPSEVLLKILERLPVKSLVRCMCVCKAWKSIIAADSFITSHHLQTNRANNSSLFFHDRSGSEGLRSLCSEGDILLLWKFPFARVVGTCNGLVCFSNYPESVFTQYVIWNPSIHKYVKLPKPSLAALPNNIHLPLPEIFCGFGYDSQNNDFKLVRFFDPPQAEIYSHASRSWRTITFAASPFYMNHDSKPKFVNGVLHWMAFRRINGMSYNFILTFDLVEEKIGELMLPHCLKGAVLYVRIFTGGNSLVVILDKEYSCHEKCCEIWVMKEYGVVESWNQLFHFPIKDGSGSGLALTNSGELVLRTAEGIIIRDPINGVEKKLGRMSFTFVDYYVESLFLMNEENREPTRECLQNISKLGNGVSILLFGDQSKRL